MKTYTAEEVAAKGLAQDGNTKKMVFYNGFYDVFVKILKNEGPRGFYKGIVPNLARIFPSSGLFFLCYELTLA